MDIGNGVKPTIPINTAGDGGGKFDYEDAGEDSRSVTESLTNIRDSTDLSVAP